MNQDGFGSNCIVDKHTKTSVKICVLANIQKVKYRPIISVDQYRLVMHWYLNFAQFRYRDRYQAKLPTPNSFSWFIHFLSGTGIIATC